MNPILQTFLSRMNKMLHWKVTYNNYFNFFQSVRILMVSMTLIQFNMNTVIDNLETIQEEQIVSDDEESRIYRGQGKLLNKIIHIHVYRY